MAKGQKTENIEVKENEKVQKNESALVSVAENNVEVEPEKEMPENVEVINTEDVPLLNKEEIKEQTEFDKSRGLEVSEEYTEQKYQKVMEYQSPKKKRKSTIINLCLLLINLIFLVTIVKSLMKNVGEKNFLDVLQEQGSKCWWLLGGLLIYVLFMLVQTLMYYVLIKDITGKKRMKLAYDVAVVGKYYDNATPFAAGGQPMQIVRLVQNGVSVGTSTSIPIIKLIIKLIIYFYIYIIDDHTFHYPSLIV